MSGAIDQLARNQAQKALDEIGSHEKLCAERYDNIHEKLGLVLKVLGWGGGTVMTVILGLLAFLASHAFNVNNEQQTYLKAKLDVLEQQQAHGPEAGQ